MVTVPPSVSIADGLRPTRAGELPLRVAMQTGVQTVTVSEDAIREAMRILLHRAKLVVEPSGAASLAALLEAKLDLAEARVALVLTGGNVDPAVLNQSTASP